MIRSFACKETQRLFGREKVRKIPADLQRTALRKLRMLDAATSLEDLKVPPANRLEKLKGNREGQFSIRINDQWRICFRFAARNRGAGPVGHSAPSSLGRGQNCDVFEVEIVDYH